MIATLGLLASIGLLIWLALRGVNVIFAAVLCSLVVIITSGLPLASTLDKSFTFGNLGAFTFAGRFFLIFAAGAMFGRAMGESGAAAGIAVALVRKLGAHNALWITTIACGLLTYGGVVAFVVIFAMYPLGLRLLSESNIPKRLFCAALTLGGGTFTLTALPGTPSVQNIIPTLYLGTNLYSGAILGLVGGTIMFGLGMAYLEWQRRRALAAGEGFVPAPGEAIAQGSDSEAEALPHAGLAALPLIAVLALIILPRVATSILPEALVGFATSQPILWPSIALVAGCVLCLALFPRIRTKPLNVLGEGVQDAIMPLLATSAVIGFGGVVAQTEAFVAFSQAASGLFSNPLMSMFATISLVSGITGSASGGLQIFMETMAPQYLAMGIDAGELHRLAVMASGGFDSLPHCGAIVAMLAITRMSHKEAYRDVAVVTVVIPVIAVLICIALAAYI